MRKYYIINNEKNEDEYLCKSKGRFTDKFGNVRRVMVYWSRFSDEQHRLKMIYLRAMLELIFIRILNKDLNPRMEEINS